MSEALIQCLEEKIAVLSEIRSRLIQNKIEASTKIKVGDIISWTLGSKSAPLARRGRVLEIRGFLDRPAFTVLCLRKDGKPGRTSTVYCWGNPKAEIPADDDGGEEGEGDE